MKGYRRESAALGLGYTGLSLLVSFLTPYLLLTLGVLGRSRDTGLLAIAFPGPIAVAIAVATRAGLTGKLNAPSASAAIAGLASAAFVWGTMRWISGDAYYMFIGPAAAILTSFLLTEAVVRWSQPPRYQEALVVMFASLVVLPALAAVPLTCCEGRYGYWLPIAWPLLVLSATIAIVWIARWAFSRRRG